MIDANSAIASINHIEDPIIDFACSNVPIIVPSKISKELLNKIELSGTSPVLTYNSDAALKDILGSSKKKTDQKDTGVKDIPRSVMEYFTNALNSLYTPSSISLSNPRYLITMDKHTFATGPHKGLSYKEVRLHHPQFFISLLSQNYGQAYEFSPFIQYCMEFLKTTF